MNSFEILAPEELINISGGGLDWDYIATVGAVVIYTGAIVAGGVAGGVPGATAVASVVGESLALAVSGL